MILFQLRPHSHNQGQDLEPPFGERDNLKPWSFTLNLTWPAPFCWSYPGLRQ